MINTGYMKGHSLRSEYKESIMAKRVRKFSYDFSSRELVFLVISFVCIATLIFALGFKIGRGWQLTLSPSLADQDNKNKTADDSVQQPTTLMARSEADKARVEEKKPAEDLISFDVLSNTAKIKPEDIKLQITPEYAPPPPVATPAKDSTSSKDKEKEKEKAREKEKAKEKEKESLAHANVSASPVMPIQLGGDKKYTIQVSSFKDKAQAQTFEAKLKKKGFAAQITTVEIKDSGLWYRIRVGNYKDRKEAEKIAEQLRLQEKVPTFIAFLYSN